ncbi:ATP-grasp domain-containing protein [Flavobacterium difficile]|uniref:ATP-grasp domain-containing protein n=1 Tax=Flavobacterium difficile TaxID=2709659 RepID=A0ABX0I6B3_9FLAO|nr:ATP-grasp domain-containing protein [Flavobacterium difficile]NHM01334.1 ATP-grasp domain-containing protein [Flavobacterium difficile]
MKNVLVFPCGTEIGLEINRALAHSTHFNLIGANSYPDHGKYVYEKYIESIPHIDEPDFIAILNEIIEKLSIDFIIPAHDSVVLKLSEYSSDIHAKVITSNFNTCSLTRSKLKTYEFFKNKIPTPIIYNITNCNTFPVFLKPDVGQGSKGTYKVNSQEEIDFYFAKDPTLLALEYLPGKEYTIDCFTNKKGELLYSQARERARINNGISVNSKLVFNEKFQKLAEKINSEIKFNGVWFFQVKENNIGEFVLMEIAPRIAGTMALSRILGVNFIQLSIFNEMDIDVSICINNFNVEIDRALFSRFKIDYKYENVYIDFDDTITFKTKVNTDVMKFIYQCKNENIKLYLITKHKYNIYTTLENLCIPTTLFEEIIVLQPTDLKSQAIKHKQKTIFIDDSFAERKDVSEKLNIPCFNIDSIEALLDWKN